MSNQNQRHDRTAFDLDRPEDPFKALGNETRLEILRALYERTQEAGGGPRDATLSYTRLREAVGIEDKGNFNYHLRQLDGRFVDDAGDDEGYRLTFAGFEIAKVIDVDAWRSHEPLGPVVLESASASEPDAGSDDAEPVSAAGETGDAAPLTATYEDSVVTVSRGDEPLYAHAVRPTGAADREMDLEALLDVASTLWRHTIDRILEGICPYCHARVERSLEIDDDRHWTYSFAATCAECGPLGGSHVGVAVRAHPAVVSLFWDHGIDITDRRIWTLPFVDDEAVTVVGEDPPRLRIDVECEGDRLEVIVDDAVRVVGTNRPDAVE